jgi:hypothetical protein
MRHGIVVGGEDSYCVAGIALAGQQPVDIGEKIVVLIAHMPPHLADIIVEKPEHTRGKVGISAEIYGIEQFASYSWQKEVQKISMCTLKISNERSQVDPVD